MSAAMMPKVISTESMAETWSTLRITDSAGRRRASQVDGRAGQARPGGRA